MNKQSITQTIKADDGSTVRDVDMNSTTVSTVFGRNTTISGSNISIGNIVRGDIDQSVQTVVQSVGTRGVSMGGSASNVAINTGNNNQVITQSIQATKGSSVRGISMTSGSVQVTERVPVASQLVRVHQTILPLLFDYRVRELVQQPVETVRRLIENVVDVYADMEKQRLRFSILYTMSHDTPALVSQLSETVVQFLESVTTRSVLFDSVSCTGIHAIIDEVLDAKS